MILRPRGRVPSLLAWGLLVGGVALLMTLPGGRPAAGITMGHVPAGFLFLLAGLVFGVSHPAGRAWLGAVLLGWVPAVAGVLLIIQGDDPAPVGVRLVLMLAPAVLAAAGSGIAAALARRRARRG